MKNSTLLVAGGIALVAILLFSKKASATPTLVPTAYPGAGTTAGNVGAIAGAGATLATAFKNLFTGPTTAPLTSGASASNPNDILALPTTPIPSDDLQSLAALDY